MKPDRKNILTITAVWFLSLAAVFALGALSGFALRVARERVEVSPDPGRSTEVAERAVIVEKLTGLKPPPAALHGFAPEMRQALARALEEPDRWERSYQARRILEGVTLREIYESVNFINSLSVGPRRDEAQELLLERWGTLDGRSAVAYAISETDYWQREKAVAAALVGWANVEPEEAWSWALENPGDDTFSSARLNLLMRRIAQTNPSLAFSYAAAVPDEALRIDAIKSVSNVLVDNDRRDEAIVLVENLPKGVPRSLAIAHLAQGWSRYEPEMAAAWVKSLKDKSALLQAAPPVARMWSALYPSRAADWALSLPAGNTRRESIRSVIERWLEDAGPNEAAQWLNQIPAHIDLDSAFQKVGFAMMEIDPSAAMTWAESITDINLRNVTTRLIAARWGQFDPQAAQDYMEFSDLPPVEIKIIQLNPAEPIEVKPGTTIEIITPVNP